MRTLNVKNMLLLGALVTSSTLAQAGDKVAKGTYKPLKGWVKTYEVADPSQGEQPEQLGRYRVYLVNTDWLNMTSQERKNTKYMLKLEGIVRGHIDSQTFLATHTLTDYSRSYIIRTADDQLIPTSGDPYCSTGSPMQITERVNLVAATGEYSTLSGGTLVFEGTVNNCPTLPQFGQNDLAIVPLQGEVTFN